MKIGVDIDGVVADFVTPFLPVLGELLERDVRYEEITSYLFQDVFGYDDEMEVRVREEIDRRDILRDLPALPGAVDAIRRLGKDHEIHFVTARRDAKWGALTREWLDRKGFPYDLVLFREGRKAEAGEGFYLFVEDCLENARDLATQNIHVCLMDQPWNQAEELPERCARVRSWEEVEEVVKREVRQGIEK